MEGKVKVQDGNASHFRVPTNLHLHNYFCKVPQARVWNARSMHWLRNDTVQCFLTFQETRQIHTAQKKSSKASTCLCVKVNTHTQTHTHTHTHTCAWLTHQESKHTHTEHIYDDTFCTHTQHTHAIGTLNMHTLHTHKHTSTTHSMYYIANRHTCTHTHTCAHTHTPVPGFEDAHHFLHLPHSLLLVHSVIATVLHKVLQQ